MKRKRIQRPSFVVSQKRARSQGLVVVPTVRRQFVGRQAEVKHHDVAIAENIVNAGAVLSTPLNGIIEGNSNATRDGSKIHVHRVAFRGFTSPVATSDGADVVRIIFFLDKQCSGQTPTVANLLSTASHNAFRDPVTTERFTFLKDIHMSYTSNTLDVAGTGFLENWVTIDWFKDVDFVTQYQVNAATFAAISTNSIGLLTLSKEADASSVVGIFRVSYTDV